MVSVWEPRSQGEELASKKEVANVRVSSCVSDGEYYIEERAGEERHRGH